MNSAYNSVQIIIILIHPHFMCVKKFLQNGITSIKSMSDKARYFFILHHIFILHVWEHIHSLCFIGQTQFLDDQLEVERLLDSLKT